MDYLLYAVYTAVNGDVVEYQRITTTKDVYIETKNKKPTDNKYSEASIRAIMNNGRDWYTICM